MDADLKVLVWSEGCADSTQLSQVVVQDRDITELPWMSEASRNNVVNTLRTLVASDGSRSVPARREMLLGLMPSLNGELSAPTILLRMTATRVVTSGNQVLIFCVGREVSMQHKPASILLINLFNNLLFNIQNLVKKSPTQSGSRQRTLRPHDVGRRGVGFSVQRTASPERPDRPRTAASLQRVRIRHIVADGNGCQCRRGYEPRRKREHAD